MTNFKCGRIHGCCTHTASPPWVKSASAPAAMRHNHLSAGAAQQQQTATAYHRPFCNSSDRRVPSTILSKSHTSQQSQPTVQAKVAADAYWLPRRTYCKRCSTVVAAHAGPPETVNTDTKRLAVFVSGGGSNFKAIHAACLSGHINAEVVVSTKPNWCGHRTSSTVIARHSLSVAAVPADKRYYSQVHPALKHMQSHHKSLLGAASTL